MPDKLPEKAGKKHKLEVPWKWFLILHISVLLNSMSGVASKMAGRYPLMSMGFLFYYGLDLLLIFAFAIVWQQVLGHMSLTFAITNRPVRVIYSLIWSVLIFREKVTRYKLIAMLFALAGLVVILIHFMEPPLIAVSIATSFAVYAAVKKWFDLPPIMSVFLETLFLMLPALCVIIGIEVTGPGALAVATPGKYVLLLCCGVLTATPLSLFAAAATKVPMITVGLLEYLSPSIALLIGIFFMKEPFDAVQLAAFVIIWVGLVFFTYGECKGENDV